MRIKSTLRVRPAMQPKAIGWVFTINKPDTSNPIEWPSSVRYAIYQLERGVKTGTLHYQGYLEMHKQTALNAIKSILPRAHLEPRKGTVQQAVEYCTKSDTHVLGPWTHGELGKGTGYSSELAAAAALVTEGVRPSAIAEMYPTTWIRYGRGLMDLALRISKPRTSPPEIYVIWGSTGSGKSRWAFDKYPIHDIFVVPGQGTWMDCYEQQPVVIFDEFYGGIPWSELLKLTDRYPHHSQVKGSHVNFAPKTIIFTSNTHPRDWYPNIKNKGAFARRITEAIQLGDPDYKGHNDIGKAVMWPGESDTCRYCENPKDECSCRMHTGSLADSSSEELEDVCTPMDC